MNNKIFASTKEVYTFLRDKQIFNLPETFESLTPQQQDFFMEFFESCKELELEASQAAVQDCTDEFIIEVNKQLGIAGENAIENILYSNNMKIVYDN